MHSSNQRLRQDLDICVKHKVPIIITSLRAPDAVVEAALGYGGLGLDRRPLEEEYRAARAMPADGALARARQHPELS